MARQASYDTHDDSGRLFDGGELEDDAEEGSRLPLLLVIGLLVVAAFSGVVWLAYTQGVQRGREDAPRMLVAAGGPIKQAPTNPGGVETPFKGLKIYQQPAPPEDADVESTPQSPAAVTKPAKTTTTTAEPSAKPEATPRTEVASTDTGAQPPVIESIPFTANVPVNTAPVATKPPRQLPGASAAKSSTATKSVAVAKPAPVVKPAPAAKPVQASTAASTPVAVAKIPAAAPVASGTAALQIGAYKSQEEADAAWKSFARRHSMVSAYASEVKKVDLGDKGIWYRLRLAGFSDKSAAADFCDKLKADGGTCFLAR